MSNVTTLSLRKLLFSLSHPSCWQALAHRVAPTIEHRELVRSLDIDLLIDVGANRGQFSLITRLEHPTLPIHAFEPLPSEAAIYRKVFSRSGMVTLHEIALGDKTGKANIHLSRRADSSSLLPIGQLQTNHFPSTEEVGTLEINVGVLDELQEVWRRSQKALLKLDVQGFELNVLKGAQQALKHCAYVYAECSEVPLYTGQALYPEVLAFLSAREFSPVRRVNEQFVDGKLVQADYLFHRNTIA